MKNKKCLCVFVCVMFYCSNVTNVIKTKRNVKVKLNVEIKLLFSVIYYHFKQIIKIKYNYFHLGGCFVAQCFDFKDVSRVLLSMFSSYSIIIQQTSLVYTSYNVITIYSVDISIVKHQCVFFILIDIYAISYR